MYKYRLHIIAFISCLLLLPGCSVKKNTKATRMYHAMTTRYNVYFNGIENYKEELKKMQDGYEDDYTKIIYMHPVSAFSNPKATKPTGSFDRTIEKSQKAIKLHSIKKKPKKNRDKMNDPKYREYVSRDEYNPFLHNAWLLMAKAQFYKGDFLAAAATFTYIARHFTWMPELVADARLWTARCYLEMNWMYEAEDVLQKINQEGLPQGMDGKFATVNAAYLVKKGEYKEAIPFLKAAISQESNKAQRLRMTFLLAQLHTQTGDKTAAYNAYDQLIRKNPAYRTEFNARIKQTEVFPGGNNEKIIKSLRRMARDEKNKDYLDQVYYALGNLYLQNKDTVNAIKNYKLAAEKSTRNGIEKAISQLTLGELFFSKQQYVDAQPCYAEAVPLIDETYPDYKKIAKRSEVLDELVVFAQNVELQDSLQHVARLPEAERLAVVQKIIDELLRKEKEEKEEADRLAYLESQEGQGNMITEGGAKSPTAGNMNLNPNDNAWYFYNAPLVAAGKTEFQRKWGRRKLEDNWRRRDKSEFSMTDYQGENYDEETPSESGSETEVAANDSVQPSSEDPKDIQFYLQQLPQTEEDFANSNDIITDGLFNMGLILKNKLEDFPSSIHSFETLDVRFPENEFRLEAYYNLYLMYMRMGDMANADLYKQRIINLFPESKYALALSDPNYLDNLRNMDRVQDSLYVKSYEAYLSNRGREVHDNYAFIAKTYPLSKLLPKFLFLHALSYVGERNIPAFKAALQELLQKYPESDVSPLVNDMLKGMAQGKQIAQGGSNKRGMIWNLKLSTLMGDSTMVAQTDTTVAPFVKDKEVPHYYVLVFPTDSVQANLLLFNVANYNFSNFIVKDFDLDIISFNEITMLIVKGFNNFDEVSQYRRMLGSEKGVRLPSDVRPVMISEPNFRVLLNGRSFEEYFKFLEQNE